MHILLVEDNPLNALALMRMLERKGHRATHADGGRKALALLNDERFDLVLMDLMMPDLDGFETTRRIRGLHGPQSRVPVVAVTALLASQAQEECFRAGMDSFLTKPVSDEDFRRLTERFGPPPAGTA